MPQVHQHPVTKRWHVILEDEPGRPEISCDSAELLELFMSSIENADIAH